ncbi:uncharacterized protein LOC129764447 [Toxorhynchites rutilus septentrionalis]|uniref:uncharacterized protein LOC129764447 n=1 Tax=Toxorhynchites rutilus septentrionalis TaxID=329112 RepID=UPI00247936C0|nr:uncharacterized protein LOC129764447 [Toxorhynchites rutilus septentrionalis]
MSTHSTIFRIMARRLSRLDRSGLAKEIDVDIGTDDESIKNIEQEVLVEEKDIYQVKKKRKRGKVEAAWDEANINKLISAVEENDCIWNAGNKEYKNRDMRDASWQHITENVFDGQYSVAEVCAKWTNLRIQFRSYHAKENKRKSDQGAYSRISWRFYRQMMFINNAEDQQTEKSESNLTLEEDSVKGTPKRQISSPKSNKGTQQSAESTGDPTTAIALEGIQAALKKLSEVDSYQVFGNYIAEELRKLSDANAANRIQRKLARQLIDSLDELDYILP